VTDKNSEQREGNKSVALVAADDLYEFPLEGTSMSDALLELGVDSIAVSWSDKSVDWSSFDLILVRAAYDYVWRREEFLEWAHARSPRIFNTARALQWNTDKHYLTDLASDGIPVVETRYVEPGQQFSRADLPGRESVVKPAIGMGAIGTSLYGNGQERAAVDYVHALLAEGKTAMVQPYRSMIDDEGETGLIYFDGVFSHAIRKEPMLRIQPESDGDFREQVISSQIPTDSEREIADAAMRSAKKHIGDLLYARVDVIPGPSGPEILEVEATEPNLQLQTAEGSAARFALAIRNRIDQIGSVS
jgi:glutathione synthase/RimK-type ligase-like ATP-grasp enzyme